MARWPSRGPEPFISTITSAILRYRLISHASDRHCAPSITPLLPLLILFQPTPPDRKDGSSALVRVGEADYGSCKSCLSIRYRSSSARARLKDIATLLFLCHTGPDTQQRNSQRFSTLSGSPSLAYSDRTLPSGDPKMADIKELSDGLERLENKPLTQQRFVPTEEKAANLNKLALGAKVERSLGRRMTNQDAVMRKPLLNEKQI
ncbi:hypothetical protein DTO164E3_195 [Paecilomyces variotii]|nr:hypothetical protein DTO032I3_9113 [Paecilomyces variotii]KAJ9207909.1 hypothetical protein DTO164E3_195 [Paecilomyces variotii]KAJ9227395.1 hypothetical protein DTO169C6_36 [Paecilomyces variotii]KAJ9246125.1 hypothetical protein DTO169E5_249 [Paecilomyces variotii]KAJ9260414.1 hypothetical protein DTO207G8_459 [Paecilomyces variotii]